jgi:hypothetical protein
MQHLHLKQHEGSVGDRKRQSRIARPLQDLRQHGSRDLIGPIVGGKADYPGAEMLSPGPIPPRHLRLGMIRAPVGTPKAR